MSAVPRNDLPVVVTLPDGEAIALGRAEDGSVLLAVDLGEGRDGVMVRLPAPAAAYLSGRLAGAAGVVGRGYFDGPQTAWLLWGKRNDETKPLGCYATREQALEAERLTAEHPNADKWSDFQVTPWPLDTTPRVNFRMEMP